MTEKRKKEEHSVEENISNDYIPKNKLGDLPVQNNVNSQAQKEMEKMKKDIDKFHKQLSKKFKYIEAMGIVPAQAAKKIEEEFEVPEEDAKRNLIHVVTIIPEEKFKELGKVRLEAIKLSKEINEKLWVHVLTHVDVWNLCLDSKFDIAEAIAMSYPIFDKGLLGSMRVSQIHKTLVLKKFEKYVTSYVIGGSMLRGTAKPTSDIDVFIVINDTDVKRMPRLELKEKLRSIIQSYVNEAIAIAGVKNTLHVQTYLLTEFWEGVKDAHPVMFTFIRDGIPLFDSNAFLPWKSLLRMGKIKPSPEAIDMFMSAGDKIDENVKKRLLDIVVYDLYWGVITPSQALLMLYGQPPADIYGTVKQIKEIFVEKENMLEKKYADILEEIVIKYYKGWEHGKVKDVTGKKVDTLFKDAKDYMKRLHQLKEQIQKRISEKSIEKVYNDVFGMIGSMFNTKKETDIIKKFEEELIKKGKFPKKFLENLKFIAKVKKEIEKEEKHDKKKSKKEQKKDKITFRESKDIDKARKAGKEIIDTLIEYNQRCDFLSIDRSRFLLKTKKETLEVFFLETPFIISKNKIQKISSGKLQESNPDELREQLEKSKNQKEKQIDIKTLDILKKEFGEFELVY